MDPVHANTFHLHRKFTRARHMWPLTEARLLASHMYTDWPGIHTYAEINDRLFVNPGRNDSIQDTPSKALFFLLDAAWVRSRAERPSVSYTKVSAVSLGLANSCKYTSRNKFKQNSGSNKFLIAGDGKMKRMREP